jgi:2-dehydropantoate 2-reductase
MVQIVRESSQERKMRVAITGSGGIGRPYGAALSVAGADVTFVARGRHLAAMQNFGIRIDGTRALTLPSVQATGCPAEIGVVDPSLFCVKASDVETAGEPIRPIVGPETTVMPLYQTESAATKRRSVC